MAPASNSEPILHSRSSGQTPSASAISGVASELYSEAPLTVRLLQRGRPYICPLEEVVSLVPAGAVMFDIGCGVGLLLGYLASQGLISEGVGVDSSKAAVEAARSMQNRLSRLNTGVRLRFECASRIEEWPPGQADAVSLIDVMHHVPRAMREGLFEQAASRVKAGGVLIYKDTAPRPRWRAWANYLHDLVLARQWIHLEPVLRVESWANRAGLHLLAANHCTRWWYAHELRVFKRQSV